MTQEIWLSRKEIEEKVGVSASMLKKIRANSDIRPKGRGVASRWPLLAVCEWLLANPPVKINNKKTMKMRRLAAQVLKEHRKQEKKPGKAASKAKQPSVKVDDNQQPGLEAALDRLRAAERVTYQRWQSAFQENDSNASVYFRDWQQALDLLRKAEDNLLTVLNKRRELLPTDEVKTWLTRQIEAAKAHLLDLPGKLAPVIEGLPWPQIQKMLETEIKDALSKLSADIK